MDIRIKNEERIYPTIRKFQELIGTKQFIDDKTHDKVVELIGERIVLNPLQPNLDFGVRKTPQKYVQKELEWYESHSLCIKDMEDYPKTWDKVASQCGFVNSNYGFLVYDINNGAQFTHVKAELLKHNYSRRAIIIYTNPGMHRQYKEFGKNDFVCTNTHQFFIRDNQLVSIVNTRSTDFIFGFFSDFPWYSYVHLDLHKKLVEKYADLKVGELIFVANSLHVYEQYFDTIMKIGVI